MRELEAVGNRGYTLAFHDGRLSNLAHDYEHTASLAQWEYAGVVTEVTEDAFHVLVKAKLTAGEVLEFVSPVSRETVLIRVYDFELAKDGTRTEVVNGSQQPVIRIPFALFDQEDVEDLKARFPAFSVLRKERALTDEQWNRIRFDKLTQAIEVSGKENPKAYERRRDALAKSISQDDNQRRFKTNRVGTEGCCGKGCNGCLIFWQGEEYKLAREMLRKRKQGEMLSRSEAAALRRPAGQYS
jgi:putative protease